MANSEHGPEALQRQGTQVCENETVVVESFENRAVDHTNPYNANLLERTRSQWCQGDWESLVRIDINMIEHHPERAKLSLAIASAWMQQADSASARYFLRQALDWGCDKKLAAQILTASVHNTLGRVSAIAGDQLRMKQHFRHAVVGSGGQIELAILKRQHIELHRLGLEQKGQEITLFVPHALNEQETAITYPPHGITSYAQNFEDVMLWRALWDIEGGFYIDVGAWDPVVDSVSKAFYERGWRGISVEPLPEYAEKLRSDRPGDTVVEMLMGSEVGERVLYAVPNTGMSTASEDYADRHRQAGWSVKKQQYPVTTLAMLFTECGAQDIHWLKVDVEGMESDVFRGWGDNPVRPWIIVVEATEPNCQIPTWHDWEHFITTRDYYFAYFDGLNRFYVHEQHAKYIQTLQTPPNVFDSFTKYTHQS